MAYIVSTTQTAISTAASYTVTLGTHTTNDLLLVFVSNDGGTSAITTASSGWAMLGTGASSGDCRSQWAYKIAASGAEANPQFSGTNDEWLGVCFVVRDADPSTPFGSLVSGTDFVRTDWSTVSSTNSGSLTTAVDECLLFYSWNSDGNLRVMTCDLDDLIGLDYRSEIGQAHIVGYRQQKTAGAAPTVTMKIDTATEGGNGWVIAVRNKSGGSLQPDLRATYQVVKHYGALATQHDGTTTWQAADQFAASINSITCTSTAPTILNNETPVYFDAWGQDTSITIASNTGEAWVGGTHTITSTDMSGKVFAVQWQRPQGTTSTVQGAQGVLVGFSDGTNWVTYQIATPANFWSAGESYPAIIALGSATAYSSSGSINWSAVTRIGYFMHRITTGTSSQALFIKNAVLFGSCSITGGGSSRASNFNDAWKAFKSWKGRGYSDLQASAQVVVKVPFQIGDGTNKTYFDGAAQSLEFPQAWSSTIVDNWQMRWNANDSAVSLTVKASSSDTIKLAAGVAATDTLQDLTIDSASSTSATYDFGQSFVGWTPTWKTGVACIGATFSGCGPVNFKGASPTTITVKNTLATASEAAISFDANGATLTTSTIDITGTSAGYHISLGASVTSITLNGNTLTGTPTNFVDKIYSELASGTLTITWDGEGTALANSDVTFIGESTAVANVVAPTLQRGLQFTGLLAGSFVRVVKNSDESELFVDTNSSTSETWDDATSGSLAVSYMIQKPGYEPIGPISVTVTGAVSGGIQTVPVTQVPARWYVASSGLTLNTNAFANATTKKFGLTAASTLQNFASYLMEQWITLGGTGGAFANKPWPLAANGPNSFTWLNGWEADLTTYPNTIANFSRDGMRYLDTNNVMTAQWAAILTDGVPSGARVRFKQTDGGTTQSAAVTSGNMDQLVQIYGDATHGNFDYRGYLVLKVQEAGYDQAEADVVATYGNLEDQLYVVGLAPAANGVATGDPALANPPTITDHAGSPETWNSKAFSITIQDSVAGNSGTDIMRWLRHAFETGGSFQGKDAFNWHDLVQTNGSAFKTVRGKVYGDTGAALKGVRVIKAGSSDPHSDFTLFTADDGTTYSPPVIANATATVLASSRVQLYNVTQAAEIDNVFVAGTSYSKTITTEANVGDTLRLRVCKKGRQDALVFGVWAAAGLSFIVSQPEEPSYTTWGIDGDTVTEYSFDAGNVQIDANDVDGVSQKTRLGAWFSAAMASPSSGVGIANFFGAFSFLSPSALRINVDVADVKLENINPNAALTFSDLDVRLYCSDGSTIIAPTSYTIHNDYNGVPDHSIITVNGGSVITGDISTVLAAIPSASTNANAVRTELATELAYIDAPISGVGGGSAADIASAVWTDGKALTVGKFLGLNEE